MKSRAKHRGSSKPDVVRLALRVDSFTHELLCLLALGTTLSEGQVVAVLLEPDPMEGFATIVKSLRALWRDRDDELKTDRSRDAKLDLEDP